MYRIWLILFIIIFVIRLIWIYQLGNIDFIQLRNSIKNGFDKIYKHLMLLGFKDDIFKRLRYFFISLSLVLFLLLALTGIFPVVALGEPLSGLLLIIHVTIAPFFVVALMLTAVFWAHFQQFGHSDFIYLKEIRLKKEKQNPSENTRLFWQKLCFWLFLVFSVPAILSVILSMFPFFGTNGQIVMLDIHRYSVLILMIVSLFYSEVLLKSNIKILKDDQDKI